MTELELFAVCRQFGRARLQALINEELAWGDVGLAITTGLTQFHVPWAQATGELRRRIAHPLVFPDIGP